MDTIEARRESFAGVVLAVFRAGVLISEAIPTSSALEFIATDVSDSGGEAGEAVYASTDSDFGSKGGVIHSLDVGGRTWELHFRAGDSLRPTTSAAVRAFAILGVIVSFMIRGVARPPDTGAKRLEFSRTGQEAMTFETFELAELAGDVLLALNDDLVTLAPSG